MPETRSPLDAADLRARVGKVLDAFLAARTAQLEAVSEDLAEMGEAASALLAGGKRLRPAFCYWGYRGAGGADSEAILAAASSLELLHACALVHDDVMDSSDTRRGLPAAHRRFAALHELGGWRGPAEDFGVGAAILLGDLCLSWSDELLYGCGLAADALAAGKVVYDVMRTELMAGQYLDLAEQAAPVSDPVRVQRVLRYKSAKYTVERPLHLGAALAGAGAEVVGAYSAFGLPVGEAFQLRDDILGVFGDPARTGKPAGDDLRGGKRTVLVATAAQRADAGDRARLDRLLGDPSLDDAGVAWLRDLIVATGARDHVETVITELTAQGLDALRGAPVQASATSVLVALATAATQRQD